MVFVVVEVMIAVYVVRRRKARSERTVSEKFIENRVPLRVYEVKQESDYMSGARSTILQLSPDDHTIPENTG